MTKQFEYKIEISEMGEEELNNLGEEGWELVNFTEVIVNPDNSSKSFFTYIFKRERKGK